MQRAGSTRLGSPSGTQLRLGRKDMSPSAEQCQTAIRETSRPNAESAAGGAVDPWCRRSTVLLRPLPRCDFLISALPASSSHTFGQLAGSPKGPAEVRRRPDVAEAGPYHA